MEIGYASNQQRSLKGMVNIPLAEDWALRLAGSSTWQDNYVLERTTGDAVNKQNEPTRLFRRQFILSHATLVDSSNRR